MLLLGNPVTYLLFFFCWSLWVWDDLGNFGAAPFVSELGDFLGAWNLSFWKGNLTLFNFSHCIMDGFPLVSIIFVLIVYCAIHHSLNCWISKGAILGNYRLETLSFIIGIFSCKRYIHFLLDEAFDLPKFNGGL